MRWLVFLLLFLSNSLFVQANERLHKQDITTLKFKENKGQITDQYYQSRKDIDFQLAIGTMSVFIGKGKLHYQWNEPISAVSNIPQNDNSEDFAHKIIQPSPSINTYRLDMELLGINPNAYIIAEDILPDIDIYYTNGNRGLSVRSYKKITYKNIYHGIDWVIYINGNDLKYDFVVHPGANAAEIKMSYWGANSLSLENGKLIIQTPLGKVEEESPYAYANEISSEVHSAFHLKDNIVSFAIDSYSGTLVIDPIIRLEWATYYGGSGREWSSISTGRTYDAYSNAVTTDYEGNVIMAGVTSSINNIATVGAHQQFFGGGNANVGGGGTQYVHGDAFLVKFNASGQRLWATYYGGEGNEHTGRGKSIACDLDGNIYWAGTSDSKNGIATAYTHQTDLSGPAYVLSYDTIWHPDNFLVKFNKDGVRQWATYCGGEYWEEGGSVAVSKDGATIYLAGDSRSDSGIATPGAEISTIGNPINQTRNSAIGYIARFDGNGQRLWGAFVGNRGIYHNINDIALDNLGYLYITGRTGDGAFISFFDNYVATVGGFQVLIGGGCPPINPVCPTDAFLQKWDEQGKRLWGTFYGGDRHDVAYGVVCDQDNNVYIAGATQSNDGTTHGVWSIATPGSFQSTYSGGDSPFFNNAFLAKFNTLGERQWGTYLGEQETFSSAFAIDYAKNKVFLTGTTSTKKLATDCAHQTESEDNTVFLASFTTAGMLEQYTYYGGKGNDLGYSITIDKQSQASIYLAGYTSSVERIATPGSFLDSFYFPGSYDAFLAKFSFPILKDTSVCFTVDSIRIVAKDTLKSNYEWNTGILGYSHWVKQSGRYFVKYKTESGCFLVDTFMINIHPLPILEVSRTCPEKGKGSASAIVSENNKNSYTYSWLDVNGRVLQSKESTEGDALFDLDTGWYSLQITTSGGCDTTIPFEIKSYPSPDLSAISDTVISGRSVMLWAAGAESYNWNPEIWLDNPTISTPLCHPLEPITYTVTGTNKYGCTASKTVRIDLKDILQMPNAFSPNGDGLNDIFRIEQLGVFNLRDFKIFNRWGELIFFTTNITTGWDGTHKGNPVEVGTYYYSIRISTRNENKIKEIKGDVLLLR